VALAELFECMRLLVREFVRENIDASIGTTAYNPSHTLAFWWPGPASGAAYFSMTFFTRLTSGPSTSMTRFSLSRRPRNSSGRTSRSKSNPALPSRAWVTASENLAGCAVARTI
jgi:hypothetical protein